MNSYDIILTNGTDRKEITTRANSGDAARAEALEQAAKLTEETGTNWRVSRCDPA